MPSDFSVVVEKGVVLFFCVIFAGVKNLVWIIVAMMVLGAVVLGCDDVPRYDGRLTAADSLIHDHADSALTMLEALAPSDLATEGDRAYHDLLLTQARYKCYKPATTDSTINRALAYYRAHPNEQEKLTRAYIYKGTVMEELGHPDSAMFYYKQAEATADTCDYANLGQINTRIASLYRIYYGDKLICYDKYNKALHYYIFTGNKRLQHNCLYNMASCLGITHHGNAVPLLEKARYLAIDLKDSLKIFQCQELLCRILSGQDSTRCKAKRIALGCLKDFSHFINNNLLLTLADIYTNENQLDSAQFFLNYVNEYIEAGAIDQVKSTKYTILSLIAAKKGNISSSKHYADLSLRINDSIANSNRKYQIQKIENNQNEFVSAKDKNTIFHLKWWVVVLLIIILLIATIGFSLHVYREMTFSRIIKEIELKNQKAAAVNEHEDLLKQIGSQNAVIEEFVNSMVSFVQTVIDTCENDSPAVIRIKVRDGIKKAITDDFWRELRNYLDNQYDNMISEIAVNPKITQKDLRFIELSCCGFDYIEIAVTLNYTPKYVSQKRSEIAKKLNLNAPLQEHLEKLMIQKSTIVCLRNQ